MSTSEKRVLIPGPDHPITITPFEGRVTVISGDVRIADTTSALELRESTYPPVYYAPMADVHGGVLSATGTQTCCPFKGDASYYSVMNPAGGEIVRTPSGTTGSRTRRSPRSMTTSPSTQTEWTSRSKPPELS